ncbi:MAG: hypothetical protein AB9907_13100 [Flexilinea sp.]
MTSKPEKIQTCYKHPNRETLLRCNRCDRPICMDCAVLTPTGYRCKDCINEQQKRFNTSLNRDYIAAGLIAFAFGFFGSYLLIFLRFVSGIFALLLGPLAGTAIVSLVRMVTQRRRSPLLTKTTVIAAAIGGILPLIRNISNFFQSLFLGNFGLLFSNTLEVGWGVAYVALLCAVIVSNMKGFSIRRY